MKKILLLLALIFTLSPIYSQSTSLIGEWKLDSVNIVQVCQQNIETPIQYRDIVDIVPFILDELKLSDDNKCKYIQNKYEVESSYSSKDNVITIKVDDNYFSYQYTLDDKLFLKGEFYGGTPSGEYVKYKISLSYSHN